MRIDSIHEFIRDLINKEQKGYNSPEQIDLALDRASLWLYNIYHTQYALSQESQDALSPFKKELDFATDVNGAYTIPASEGYQNLLGGGIIFNSPVVGNVRSKIDFVTEDQYDDRCRSQLHAPTASDPIGLVTGLGQIRLTPARVYAGTVRFLRRPKAPKYAYAQAGRVVTYNDGTSVQLEWAERYQNKIILKALEFLGLNLGEDRLVELGDALSKSNA